MGGSIRKHPVYGEQLLRKKMNKKVWELFIHKVDVYLSSMLTDYSELTFNEKRIYWDQFANPGFGIEGVEDVLVSTTRLIRLIDFNFADPQTFYKIVYLGLIILKLKDVLWYLLDLLIVLNLGLDGVRLLISVLLNQDRQPM